MKTVSLRFTDKFAPREGTIAAHQKILDRQDFCWYGKMGAPISKQVAQELLSNDSPKFLLIHSGRADRYWVYFDDISWKTPQLNDFPEYYHDTAHNFKTWFRVKRFCPAEKGVMAKCTVCSSGAPLSEASHHSMSPYFIINYDDIAEEKKA